MEEEEMMMLVANLNDLYQGCLTLVLKGHRVLVCGKLQTSSTLTWNETEFEQVCEIYGLSVTMIDQ